ncbi:MAG: PilZ domain-containing protein [Novosphingobium sp.]|nr:PilZ domain-containing protein [Novosphingobium sp.]
MSYHEHNFVSADEARSPRQRRLIRAQLNDGFGANFDIVIRNVSETGIGASMQGVPPLRGSAVTIMIPQGMAMSGTVRWVDGTGFGIALDDAIDLQTLTDVMQRKQNTISNEGQWEVRTLHQVHSGHPDPNKIRKI